MQQNQIGPKYLVNDAVWLKNTNILTPSYVKKVVKLIDNSGQDYFMYEVEFLETPNSDEMITDEFEEHELATYVPRRELLDEFLFTVGLCVMPIPQNVPQRQYGHFQQMEYRQENRRPQFRANAA